MAVIHVKLRGKVGGKEINDLNTNQFFVAMVTNDVGIILFSISYKSFRLDHFL